MQRIGLFAGQDCAGAVHICFRVDGNIGGVGTQTPQRHHGTVGICCAKVADGVAEIGPLTHLARIALRFAQQLFLQLEQHQLPAQPAEQTQRLVIELLTGADMQCCKLPEYRRICRSGRVGFHQLVSGIKEFLCVHSKNVLYRHKVIGRVVAACGGGPSTRLIGGKRHQLHLILNSPDVGQFLLSGKHDAGNGPDHRGRHINALHPFRQFALPVCTGNGIKPRRFQHSGGVCPRIQHLYIKKAVGLRHAVDHWFCADIQKRLRIDGIHIRRNHHTGRCICQLFRMDELVDGGLVACSCAGVCGSRPRSIHDHQRKGVQIRLLQKVLCSQRLLCGCGFLYGQKCSCANHRSRSRNVQKITAGHFHNMRPPVMSFALCALWEKTIWLSVFRIHGACLKVNCFCAFHVKIVKVDKAACEHRCLCGSFAYRSDPEHSRPDPYPYKRTGVCVP